MEQEDMSKARMTSNPTDLIERLEPTVTELAGWHLSNADNLEAEIEADDPNADMYARVVEMGRATANTLTQQAGEIEALREALRGVMAQNIVHTGPLDAEREVRHWLRERRLGNGAAQAMLTAYAALSTTTDVIEG